MQKMVLALCLIVGSCVAAFAQSEVLCNDGVDNDGDGLVDCADGNCQFAVTIEKGCRCYDNADNDGDGKIDKADPDCASYFGLTFVGQGSDCSITPPGSASPFTGVGNPIVSGQNTADTQSKVAVGDVDGDGYPDAVITSKWNSEVRVVSTGNFSGFASGDIKADFKTTGQGAAIFPSAPNGDPCDPKNLLFEHEVLIADIDHVKAADGKYKAEIFAIVSNRKGNPESPPTCYFLIAFRYPVGGGTLDVLPGYPVRVGTDRPGVPGVADFDGDGKAEIYLKNRIYAAENGTLLGDGGGNWDSEINSAPAAANITGDSKLELICGNLIYSVPSLASRTTQTLTLFADMNATSAVKYFPRVYDDVVEYGLDNHSSTSVADIDEDGFIDVLMSGSTIKYPAAQNTTIFYWNVKKGKVSTYQPPDPTFASGWPWGTGRINIGDSDGDGDTEATFIAGSQIFNMEFDLATNRETIMPSPKWTRTINDSRSGVLTVTIYDFNNDANPEMVYRDSQELVVIDGKTGTNKQWSAVCQSHTFTEGPIIADVNGDGGTDICVPCYRNANAFNINGGLQQQALGEVRLFFSSANAWLPTRKVWNQPGYFVVNINDDLTVPFPQLDQNMVFGTAACPNGLPGPQMPLNIFLNQVPHLSASGCPVYPAPDLTFIGDTPNPTSTDTDGDGTYTPAVVVIPPICGDLGIKVFFNIINNGDLPISDNVPVSFFNGDPTANPVTATKLFSSTIAINNLQVGQKLVTPSMMFNGPGTTFKLYIVLYNDGNVLPISLAGQSTKECTIANNIYSVDVVPDPFTVTVEKLTDNMKCSAAAADNGSLRAHIFKGGVEVTDYSPFAFQWYTGTGTASPIAGPAGTAYNLLGRPAGDYTVVVTNTQKGCKSLPITGTVAQTVIDPTINITVLSDQTQCSPANGKLQADIVGGNAGYTFDWYDISLVPLGISGPIANNLVAGNYVVLVSKSGCTKTSASANVLGPKIPDVQASVLQNVVDCSNPNSGIVTANALFNGVVQPAANYTFNWYFYDNPTLTRGSILPAANGTGQTRTGLAVGYYQVEVKEISTQCTSPQMPVAHVVNQQVIPDPPVITQLAAQTSCDPTKPNGILTADVFIGGVAQSPAGFTFEWFKGQNTLAVNKVTTTSDVNGKTLNKVTGGGIPYTVKVTTPNNCFSTSDFTITENVVKPVVTLAQLTPNSICDPAKASGTYSGSLKATVTFGGSPVTLPDNNYQFTWLDGSNAVIPVADNKNPVLTGLKEGNYSISVTRADLFCTSAPDAEPILKATVLPLIKTDSIASTNCVVVYKGSNISNGKVMIKTIDGLLPSATTNYLYQWLDNSLANIPGATSDVVNKVQGGLNYTIHVTNKTSGCENTHTIPLPDASVIPVVDLVVVSPNSICDPAIAGIPFNGKIQANFTTTSGNATDYQYAWKNVTANTSLGTTPPAQAGLTANQFGGLNGNITYSVVAENTVLGCTSGASQELLPNALLLPVIKTDSIPSTNCVVVYKGSNISNGSVKILTVDGFNPTATTDYSYLWSDNGSVTSVSGQTGNQVIKVQGGFAYTVTVTNKLTGCKNTHSTPLPDKSVIPVVALSVLNPNGICDPALASSTYTGKIQAAFTVTSGNAANYEYTWRNVTNNIALGKTPPAQPTLTVLQFGGLNGNKTYGIIAENTVLGCTSTEAQIFLPNVIKLPVIETDSIPSTNCIPAKVNGRVRVVSIDGLSPASVNYTMLWSDDGLTPTSVAGQTISTIPNVQGGFQYTVAITNKTTGCVNTHSIPLPDLSKKPVIDLVKVKDNITCDLVALGASGEIRATVTDHSVVQNPAIGTLPLNYTITWSTSANGEVLSALGPGTYTATVEDTNLGCVSDPDSQTILNAFDYPAIAVPTPTDQTSCDALAPNGAVQATITGGPIGTTFKYEWHQGIGVTGSILASATSRPNGTVTTLSNRSSDDYTLFVRNENTGCETIKSAFVPNNLTYPVVTLNSTSQVTVCRPTPDGAAQATLSNLSALPGVNYDLFYVYTFQGGSFPTDPAVIQASTDPKNIANGSAMVPPQYGNMAPGYLTALIVDRNTKCESNPSTVQIIDATVQNKIQVNGTTNAAFCGGIGGAIDVTISGGVAPQTYEWYKGTPSNNNINFYTNLPDMTSAAAVAGASGTVNGTAEDLGPPSNPVGGVGAGTYTIIVTDAKGCGAYFVKNVPFTNPPTFTVIETDVRRCIAPFDGRVDVNITSGTSAPGYTIEIFSGNGPTGTLLASSGPTVSPASNFAGALPKGQYYVQVTDVDPVNSPCPLGQGVELEQVVFNPIVATNNILPNTSCDPDNFGSGSVVLNAKPDSQQDLLLAPVDFQVTGIVSNTPATPGPVGFTPNFDIPDNGTNSSAIPGFGSGPYTITVTDLNSGCATDVVANIPDQPVLPQIFSVSSQDDSYCAPLSNGQVLVTAVGPGTIPDYHYEWYTSSDLSTSANLVYEDDGGGATTGELFDKTKVTGWSAGVPAGKGWSFGAIAGAGNGDRTYYVRAKRVTGTTGVGCYTQLEQKVILDTHKTPDIKLTTFANTSCIPTANEGVIRANTDIAVDPLDANVRNTATYTYTWNPDPAGGNTSPAPGVARAVDFDITALNENGGAPYTITSTNSVNGCAVSGTATVPTNKLPISVISFSKLDQLICTADGEARVTEVKIDASASASPAVYNFATAAQLQGNFDFQWFSGDADGDNNASTFDNTSPLEFTPGNDITDVVLTDDGAVTLQPYSAMGAGTYYVIAKRKPGLTPGAGCTTAPTRITIEDKHINPQVTSIKGFANTSCDAAVTEGRIELTVKTTSGVGAESGSTYSYTWTQANPVGNPLGSGNDNNVANATATTVYTIPPSYTPPPAVPVPGSALKEDTYTVVVKNDYSGCTTTVQSVITPTRYPLTLISYTSQDQLICAPDGRITVTDVKIDASTSNLGLFDYNTPALLSANFNLSWFKAAAATPGTFNPATPLTDALSNPITDATLSEDPLQTGQPFPTMGEGTYYVIATRKPGMTPGAGCATTPVRIDLVKQVNTPQITSLKAFNNTSCVSAVDEGRIELAVSTSSSVPAESGSTYSYQWVQSNLAGNPGGGGNSPTTGSALTIPPTFPAAGLKDDTYTITVQNDYSKCTTTQQAVISPAKLPITLISYITEDQLICKSDGKITVTKISIDATSSGLGVFNYNTPATLAANFDLEWFKSTTDPTVFDPLAPLKDAANAVITDHVLTEDPAFTSQPYLAMGGGTYYVTGTRKVGLSPGAGCTTTPVRVDIKDLHTDPELAFASVANSACNPAKANGSVTATATELNGSMGTYTYAWLFNSAPHASVTNTIPNALDGNYQLTVTNTATGCKFTSDYKLILDPTMSTPNVIDVATIDPVDCKPTGSAEVTKITLGSTTSSVLFPPNIPPDNTITGPALATFGYEWYQGAFTPSAQIAGQTAPLLPNLLPGTYFVIVQDPSTDCKSGPKEVVIDDDQIVYPVPRILQTVKQISCTATGTAALMSTGDGKDDTDPNYTFQWFPSLDLSGAQFATTSTITNLAVGDYSVNITNTVTGCSASALYTVPDEAPLFKPEVSVGGYPRTLCIGQDGSVTARVTNLKPSPSEYPFVYSFTADLYIGSSPNLSAAPDFPSMAPIPGFVADYEQLSLPQGPYTVRVTDNNTGCVSIAAAEVVDARENPLIVIFEDNPLTNCDPVRANGQLSATADGGRVVGYSFSWFQGAAVPVPAGVPLTTNDKLIAKGAGSYTVRVVNDLTGCQADLSGDITDATVIPPVPDPKVVFDRTNCITPNGWVNASVGGVIFNYTFNWYDGSTLKSSSDFTGVDYQNLDIGPYTVTATDDVTGCVSPPGTVMVADKRVIPEFNISSTPSYCSDTGKPNGIGSISIELTTPDIVLDNAIWTDATLGGTVGSGPAVYDLFPGFYHVVVTSTEGCVNEGDGEVKTEIAPYNGISQNGDGQNDFFIIDCITNFPSNNVKVFNRSGVLVYEADGYNNNDVSFKGIGEKGVYMQGLNLPSGTYFYIIDKRDGSKPIAGYLELDK